MRRILIVEDNPADVYLVKEALRSAGLGEEYEWVFAEDGEEALQKLNELAELEGEDQLRLVLLDINLPKSGGMEVLQKIRGDQRLSKALVVTWTSSIAPQEAERLAELGVNRHVIKPMRLEDYVQIGTLLGDLLRNGTSTGCNGSLP